MTHGREVGGGGKRKLLWRREGWHVLTGRGWKWGDGCVFHGTLINALDIHDMFVMKGCMGLVMVDDLFFVFLLRLVDGAEL